MSSFFVKEQCFNPETLAFNIKVQVSGSKMWLFKKKLLEKAQLS